MFQILNDFKAIRQSFNRKFTLININVFCNGILKIIMMDVVTNTLYTLKLHVLCILNTLIALNIVLTKNYHLPCRVIYTLTLFSSPRLQHIIIHFGHFFILT